MQPERHDGITHLIREVHYQRQIAASKGVSNHRFLIPLINQIWRTYDWRYADMAKKGNNNGFEQFKFAAVTLTANDKASFKKWAKDFEADVFVLASNLCVAGWKLSTAWSSDNDCYITSFTNRNEKSPDANVVVTSRSGDLLESILIGAYKITVMFADKPIPTERQEDNWG